MELVLSGCSAVDAERRTQLILKHSVIAYSSQSSKITKASHHHYYKHYQQGMVTPRSLEELAKSVELAEGSSVEQSIQVALSLSYYES